LTLRKDGRGDGRKIGFEGIKKERKEGERVKKIAIDRSSIGMNYSWTIRRQHD
jgi:hypothetical protein